MMKFCCFVLFAIAVCVLGSYSDFSGASYSDYSGGSYDSSYYPDNDLPRDFCSVKATGLAEWNFTSFFEEPFVRVNMFRVKDYARFDFLSRYSVPLASLIIRPDTNDAGTFFFGQVVSQCIKAPVLTLSEYYEVGQEDGFDVYSTYDKSYYNTDGVQGKMYFNSETHKIARESFTFYYGHHEYDPSPIVVAINITYNDDVDTKYVHNDVDDLFSTDYNCGEDQHKKARSALTMVQCEAPKKVSPVMPKCGFVLNVSYDDGDWGELSVIENEDLLLVKSVYHMADERRNVMIIRCDMKNEKGRCFFVTHEFGVFGTEEYCDEEYNRVSSFIDLELLSPFKYHNEKNVLCPDESPGCKMYIFVSEESDDDEVLIVDKDGRFLVQRAGSNAMLFKYLDVPPSVDVFKYYFCNGSVLEAPSVIPCLDTASSSLPTLFVLTIALLLLFI